jgi:uncharacterized protein (TIGR00369 family)
MSIPTVLDRFPTPPCATLLGLDIIDANPEEGLVRIAFTARPEFCNAAGNVQGGFLTAMLDDCMGPAILIASDAKVFPSTIDLNVQFLAPAKPGPLIGTGRVVQIGRTIGFVEAELQDGSGTTLARARASVRLTALSRAIT